MKNFRIRYNLQNRVPAAWDTRCSSPVMALNQFHRHAQLEVGMTPKEYSITGLFEFYNSDATGRGRGVVIESAFDLPTSENPSVVQEIMEAAPGTTAFEFLATTPIKP